MERSDALNQFLREFLAEFWKLYQESFAAALAWLELRLNALVQDPPADLGGALTSLALELRTQGWEITPASMPLLEATVLQAFVRSGQTEYAASLSRERRTVESYYDDGAYVATVVPEVGEPPGAEAGTGGEHAQPSKATVERVHVPSLARGEWISGTKGNGEFEFYDTPANKIMAGKRVRFEDAHVALGGFPEESYYEGNAAAASVEIEHVTGTQSDGGAADAAMRIKRGDSSWQRPKGFRWNHAGKPGSTTMELVETDSHSIVHHRGSAAESRANARIARAGGTTAKAFAALNVYLTARDAMQAAGILNSAYDVKRGLYYFTANDESVFYVEEPDILNFWSGYRRIFVAGPRKGIAESITRKQAAEHQELAERKWGKLIPGTILTDPKFIPGTDRKTLPYYETDEFGNQVESGYVDKSGIHHVTPLRRPKGSEA